MKAAASPVKEPKVPRIFVIERYKRTFGRYSSPQHSDKSSKGGKGKTCAKNIRIERNKRMFGSLLVTTTHQVQVSGRMNLFNSVKVCGNFECFIVLLKS